MFLNNAICTKTKNHYPQTQVTLTYVGYPANRPFAILLKYLPFYSFNFERT